VRAVYEATERSGLSKRGGFTRPKRRMSEATNCFTTGGAARALSSRAL
jgi:hypothetical protein